MKIRKQIGLLANLSGEWLAGRGGRRREKGLAIDRRKEIEEENLKKRGSRGWGGGVNKTRTKRQKERKRGGEVLACKKKSKE